MTPEQKALYLKERYYRNRETALAKAKIYRELNREKINERQRLRNSLGYGRAYYAKNKAKCRQYALEWTRTNKKKAASYWKKYRDANREKVAARDALWKRVNRKAVSAYEKKRKSQDIHFYIKKTLRSRVWHSVKRQSGRKAKRTMELLGCSVASFRKRIERQFKPGMTWKNIHLDHVVPCILFDLTKPEHQKRCFHYTNYQPLLVKDNLTKGERLFHEPGTLAI